MADQVHQHEPKTRSQRRTDVIPRSCAAREAMQQDKRLPRRVAVHLVVEHRSGDGGGRERFGDGAPRLAVQHDVALTLGRDLDHP